MIQEKRIYSILIWGYEFGNIKASNSNEAKRIAVRQYNQNPPDKIKVDIDTDADHIIWKYADTEEWTDYQG